MIKVNKLKDKSILKIKDYTIVFYTESDDRGRYDITLNRTGWASPTIFSSNSIESSVGYVIGVIDMIIYNDTIDVDKELLSYQLMDAFNMTEDLLVFGKPV